MYLEYLRNSGGFSTNITSRYISNPVTHSGRNWCIPKIRHHTQKSNLVYAVQCKDLYIGETKQPLNRHMAQHRRPNSSGLDSAVYLHLKEKTHSFEDNNVHILDREDRWFERGVKEAIYVKVEKPALCRGEGLKQPLLCTMHISHPCQDSQQPGFQKQRLFS